MAKNNKSKDKGGEQQHLKPEQYLKQRARLLPIGKCYINTDADDAGLAQIFVTRCHTGGRVSIAGFLVDMKCLGVKDTFYELRINEWEVKELMDRQPLDYRECSYNEAHNRIYGSIAFAEEGGIEPHKDFQLTQYMLEEDTDVIPLIDYEYGLNGKHYLVCHSYAEANRYLPILHEHLGDDFEYTIEGQNFDDTLDEEDEDYPIDFYDTKDTGPIFIADCINHYDAEELNIIALGLGIKLNQKASLKQQQEQYISEVLKCPDDLLMRLPDNELAELEYLLTKQSSDDRIIGFPNTTEDPILYQCGFIEDVGISGWYNVYRVAEDFWAAVRPHLKEVMKDEANQMRITVENIICGLTNLYGVVSFHDVEQHLVRLLEMPLDAVSELLDIALSHSALLAMMLVRLDMDETTTNDDFKSDSGFFSRFGWNSTPELIDTIALRDNMIPSPKEFTMEETLKASTIVPQIPNREQKVFTQYLRTRLGYGNFDTRLICHHLWLRAQHEEDPDNPFGTYLDYYVHEVIERAPKRPDLSVVNKGMLALQKYMNAMPRWFLKGFAPEKIR